MNPSLIRHFILISLVVVACSSCKSTVPLQDLPHGFGSPYYQSANSLIYRAVFNYKDYHFSGLTVIKSVDADNMRVVFLSEFGPTILDLEIKDQGYTTHQVIEQLDRPMLLRLIAQDFRLILLSDLKDPDKVLLKNKVNKEMIYKVKGALVGFYTYHAPRQKILSVERKGGVGKPTTSISFEYQAHEVAEKINLVHKGLDLDLTLTLLQKN